MQATLSPTGQLGLEATAFTMLNIYGYHFNQNLNLHKKEHDADHIENVHLAYWAMDKLRKNRAHAEVCLGYELKESGREIPPAASDRKEAPASWRNLFSVSELRNEQLI